MLLEQGQDMVELSPTVLSIEHDKLVIQWSDSSEQRIAVTTLRDRCPCANCREQRSNENDPPASSLPIITIDQAQPMRIVQMQPVGNYAYSIQFSDGHATGIFTYDFLRSMKHDD